MSETYRRRRGQTNTTVDGGLHGYELTALAANSNHQTGKKTRMMGKIERKQRENGLVREIEEFVDLSELCMHLNNSLYSF